MELRRPLIIKHFEMHEVRLGAFSKVAFNQQRTANDSRFDRARHDLYISLLQPLGVKSTIQNFDGQDGNFRMAAPLCHKGSPPKLAYPKDAERRTNHPHDALARPPFGEDRSCRMPGQKYPPDRTLRSPILYKERTRTLGAAIPLIPQVLPSSTPGSD